MLDATSSQYNFKVGFEDWIRFKICIAYQYQWKQYTIAQESSVENHRNDVQVHWFDKIKWMGKSIKLQSKVRTVFDRLISMAIGRYNYPSLLFRQIIVSVIGTRVWPSRWRFHFCIFLAINFIRGHLGTLLSYAFINLFSIVLKR